MSFGYRSSFLCSTLQASSIRCSPFCGTMNCLRHCPPTTGNSCAVWNPFIWFAFGRRVA
jgi:hypothetical protein